MTDTFVRSTCCLTLAATVAGLALMPGRVSAIHQAQADADPVMLTAAVPIARELASGQEHHYRLALPPGQFAGLTVEQRGIEVVVQVLGADGKSVADFDAEPRLVGQERVGLVGDATVPGDLVVKPKYPRAPGGRYEIRLSATRAATEQDRSLFDAHKLSTAAFAANDAGKFDEAQQLASRAVTAAEAAEPKSAYVGFLLTGLANVERARGKQDTAEELFGRALAIDEAVLGREDPQTAFLLSSMSALYLSTDDYAKAEPLIRDALAITTRTLGPRHPRIIGHLMNLALLHIYREDDERALPDLQRALSIGEETLEPDDFILSTVVNNLSGIYIRLDDYDHAEPLAERALQAFEKRFGPENPRVTNTLANLAIIAREHKQYPRALELLHRAQGIRARTMGSRHPDTAALSITIGNVHRAAGEYAAAIDMYQQAFDVLESVAGPNHSYTLLAVSNAAIAYAAQGDIPKAIEFQARMEKIQEKNIELNMALGTERERFAYVDGISSRTDRTMSLHLRQAPDDRAAMELAALVLLQRKGRVLDAVSDTMATLRQQMNPADQQLLDKLSTTTKQLATLALRGPGSPPAADYHTRLDALETERETLETEISARSAAFRAQTQPVTLAAVKAAIPTDAALVEFAVYRPFDPKAANDTDAFKDPRYVAYVIRQQGDVRWTEIGTTAEVDHAVAALRETLRDPTRNDVKQRAREVDQQVMQRVRPLVGDASRLLISPIGELNLIPFEALVDEDGRYGVERFAMNYLTSGRDLLRMQVPRMSRTDPVILADPLFGEELTAQAQRPAATPASARTRRRSITTARDLSSVYFAPLAGAGEEARAIKRLFPTATLLTGQQATKAALEKVDGPGILHIATHGFFLEDAAPAAGGPNDTRAVNVAAKPENPLLRSGLALAGANLSKSGHDDGILTALEASNLNLWGTKLVTLSACETGRGAVRSGEGVYGLRRAIFLAGAESLIMSFWAVRDVITREMMTAYYAGLKDGRGRGDALRLAQLSMMKREGRKHPFYWASFVQAGDWTSLDIRNQTPK
jgi:CHAT domain-containing protein